MTAASLVFRIAYNSIYVLLCLILTALLLVVPGDFIEQALSTTHQVINLIIIAIVYVATLLIVLFVYALRLYVTRTVLASIPNTWIPIEKGDVNKEVRRMIVASLGRSAAIAWEAHPKVIPPSDISAAVASSNGDEEKTDGTKAKEGRKSLQLFRSKPPATVQDETGIAIPSLRPVWGEVEHRGWSSPASPDLPNLQYTTVLSELPNLIEAKAVSQAPADLDIVSDTPVLDADAVMLLQRVPSMTIRNYIAYLTEIGIFSNSQNSTDFLDLYERVRFSGHPMSNTTFRKLMHLFAELLRDMQPLDPSVLYNRRDLEGSYPDFNGHIDDDAPQNSTPTTPTRSITSSLSFGQSSIRSRPRVPKLAARNSSAATRGQYRTAPTTPKSKAGGTFTRSPSASSANSFTQTRRPYAASEGSSASLNSVSQGSVIRLATTQDTGDLPYVLRLTDTL
ncbi:hypothetical protein F5Y19DRAFT_413752 [Xylariaceae sp. FL1651]|nr:hypothetical protein F5Y19DRAFT_413752 [Xylariaceae sp. FL1651]